MKQDLDFRCINAGWIVMSTLVGNFLSNAGSFAKGKAYKYTALGLLGVLGFSEISCGDKKGDPGPIGPVKGGDETVMVHDTVGIKIKISNASSNFFMPVGYVKEDKSVAYAFNISAKGDDETYIGTGSTTADNTKFTMIVNAKNWKYGKKSNPNGLTYVESNNSEDYLVKYLSPDRKTSLKDIVEVSSAKKPDGGMLTTTTIKHIFEVSVHGSANGIPLFGAKYTQETFEKFHDNCAKDAGYFSQRNFMSLIKGSDNSSLYSLKKPGQRIQNASTYSLK